MMNPSHFFTQAAITRFIKYLSRESLFGKSLSFERKKLVFEVQEKYANKF